jgi:hypothetical protein
MSHESYGTVPKLLEYLLCLPWSCRVPGPAVVTLIDANLQEVSGPYYNTPPQTLNKCSGLLLVEVGSEMSSISVVLAVS